MVKSPPPLDTASAVPAWLNCAVQAGIGISFETLRNLTAGGTLWHVGQAIEQMGYKWFAKTLGKTVGKVMTGLGGAMILAEFTWCMVAEYGLEEIPVEAGNESLSGPGGTLSPIALASYLLPITAQANISYRVYASHFTDGLPHSSIFTPYYFNPSDNKYYSSNTFTTVVPNGYYASPKANNYNKYYHIVNGVSIMLYQFQPAM